MFHVFYEPATGKHYKDVKRSFGTALKKGDVYSCPECRNQKVMVRTKEAFVENCLLCGAEMIGMKGIEDFHSRSPKHLRVSPRYGRCRSYHGIKTSSGIGAFP